MNVENHMVANTSDAPWNQPDANEHECDHCHATAPLAERTDRATGITQDLCQSCDDKLTRAQNIADWEKELADSAPGDVIVVLDNSGYRHILSVREKIGAHSEIPIGDNFLFDGQGKLVSITIDNHFGIRLDNISDFQAVAL
jgi:hypothetical protein